MKLKNDDYGESRTKIISEYASKLSEEELEEILNNLAAEVKKEIKVASTNKEQLNKELESLKTRHEKILKRSQSDEVYFDILLAQRLLFTLLLVSIAFYFLRGIGGELLFSRRLTIVNIVQDLAILNKDAKQENLQFLLKLYDVLAGKEEKSGRSPKTELGSSIEAISTNVSDVKEIIVKALDKVNYKE